MRKVCRDIALKGEIPLAPALLLPQFLDEAKEREVALRCCLELVGRVDELQVYGDTTEGMLLETQEARRLGIPLIRDGREHEEF